jgi:predicted nucleic acid-binding protein
LNRGSEKASRAGVETFYSEDLPGFDDLDDVRIVNPFK